MVVAAAGNGRLAVWDVESGQQFADLEAIAGPCCFSPDGKLFVCGDADGIKVIEIASGSPCLTRKLAANEPEADQPPARHRRPVGRNVGSGVSAMAIAPDGRSFATALPDQNGVLFWSLAPDGWTPPRAKNPLDQAQLGQLWDALAAVDAPAAYDAIWRLAAAGDKAVEFIRGRLAITPATPEQTAQIEKLIADFERSTPALRDGAAEALAEFSAAAEPLLRKALANKPSPDAKAPLERALALIDSPIQRGGGDALRRIRAVRVLERIETKPAGELLESLAAAPAEARVTKDAKAALQRRRALAKR